MHIAFVFGIVAVLVSCVALGAIAISNGRNGASEGSIRATNLWIKGLWMVGLGLLLALAVTRWQTTRPAGDGVLSPTVDNSLAFSALGMIVLGLIVFLCGLWRASTAKRLVERKHDVSKARLAAELPREEAELTASVPPDDDTLWGWTDVYPGGRTEFIPV